MFGWPDCLEAELIYFDIHFLARHCNKFQLWNEIWYVENCLEYSLSTLPCSSSRFSLKVLWSDTSTSSENSSSNRVIFGLPIPYKRQVRQMSGIHPQQCSSQLLTPLPTSIRTSGQEQLPAQLHRHDAHPHPHRSRSSPGCGRRQSRSKKRSSRKKAGISRRTQTSRSRCHDRCRGRGIREGLS